VRLLVRPDHTRRFERHAIDNKIEVIDRCQVRCYGAADLYRTFIGDEVTRKATKSNSDRSDPRKNKSLAIRTVLGRMPAAKAAEVVAAVKKEYGHDVKQNMVYMVKTKRNMAADGRPRTGVGSARESTLSSAAMWVEAIKLGRQLLRATGSVANATALLKAIDG
jgi:hypothetical protein